MNSVIHDNYPSEVAICNRFELYQRLDKLFFQFLERFSESHFVLPHPSFRIIFVGIYFIVAVHMCGAIYRPVSPLHYISLPGVLPA